MIIAKQSTARTVIVGPILDADGVAVTDAVVGDLKISKNGAAPAALNASATLTHRNTGHYSLALTTSDTDTVGSLEVVIDDTTNAMPVKSITVVEEAIYDALFGASASGFDASGRVDVGAVAGQTASAAATVDFGDLATIEAVTTAIGATGSGLSAIPWNAAWDAEVQSECADALTAYNAVATTDLPSNFADLTISVTTGLVSLSADQSGVTIGTANSVSALGAQAKLDVNAECDTALTDYDAPTKAEMDSAFTEIKGATWSGTTDTLESIYNGVNGLSAASAPQLLQSTTIATLASQTSFTLTAGSADDDAYNGAIVIVTDSATSTQKAVGTVSDYTGATKTVTLLSDPAIFTMAVGDTVDILAAISNAPTAAAIRSEIDSNSTQLAAILADTNELQTDWANGGRLDLILDARASQASVNALPEAADFTTDITGSAEWATLLANIATVDTVVDAILVDTGTTIPAQITALNDLSAAEMRSAVGLAAANLDTQLSSLTSDVSEPTTAPGATATMPEMLAYVYGALRNRIDVTASAKTFYNDAGSSLWSKALSDNGATYTEAEGA